MISFVITGTLCALVALCYANWPRCCRYRAPPIPIPTPPWARSWPGSWGLLLLLEYGLAASTVAVGWSGYVGSLLADWHIIIPPELTAAPGVAIKDAAGHVIAHGVMNLPAIIGIAAVTSLLVVGISESATVNNIVVVIKLTVVIAFIIIGSRYVHAENWHPLVPAEIPARPAGNRHGPCGLRSSGPWAR